MLVRVTVVPGLVDLSPMAHAAFVRGPIKDSHGMNDPIVRFLYINASVHSEWTSCGYSRTS